MEIERNQMASLSGASAVVHALFANLPIPGRYLTAALNLFRVNLEEIPTPIVCKNRWRELKVEIDRPRDIIQKHILFQGYFEYYESRFVRDSLALGQVFLDIGANVGWHSLLAAQRVGPTGRVIACEPVSTTFGRLKRNILINNFRQIEPYQFGLSDRDAELNIFECEYDNSGAHSLHSPGSAAPIEKVKVRNGDQFLDELDLRRIDLCKIDVEGAEVEVLNGLTVTLSERRIKKLLIEINPDGLKRSSHSADELIDLVRSRGFVLRDLRTGNEVRNAQDAFGRLNFVGLLC
jgi:FkbM family methyltransferase